jgi:hypothetical protein
MNTEERACCRMMKNQCGQMDNMPASHGCCQKTPPSVHDNALDTKAVTFHPVVATIIWLAAFEMVNRPITILGPGRKSRLLASETPAFSHLNPKNLVSSSLALYFCRAGAPVCVCTGKCLELHLRWELLYERGLFDCRALAGHRIFCLLGDAGGEHAYVLVPAFS